MSNHVQSMSRAHLYFIMFSSGFIGRKAYGDWEIAEVLKVFLEKNGRTYRDIAKFDMSK